MKSLITFVLIIATVSARAQSPLTLNDRFTIAQILIHGSEENNNDCELILPGKYTKGAFAFWLWVPEYNEKSSYNRLEKDRIVVFLKSFVALDSVDRFDHVQLAYCSDREFTHPIKVWNEFLSTYYHHSDTLNKAPARMNLLLGILPFFAEPTVWGDSAEIYLDVIPEFTPKVATQDPYIKCLAFAIRYFVFQGEGDPFRIHLLTKDHDLWFGFRRDMPIGGAFH